MIRKNIKNINDFAQGTKPNKWFFKGRCSECKSVSAVVNQREIAAPLVKQGLNDNFQREQSLAFSVCCCPVSSSQWAARCFC